MKKIKLLAIIISLYAASLEAINLSINNLPALIGRRVLSQEIELGSAEIIDIPFCVIASDKNTRKDFHFSISQHNKEATTGINTFSLYNGTNKIDLSVKIASKYTKQNIMLTDYKLQEIGPNQKSDSYLGGLSCSDKNYGQSRIIFTATSLDVDFLSAGFYGADLFLNIFSENETYSIPISISLDVPKLVQIMNVKDIKLTFDESLQVYDGYSNLCVRGTTKDFNISVYSTEEDGAFILKSKDHLLPYQVILARSDNFGTKYNLPPHLKVNLQPKLIPKPTQSKPIPSKPMACTVQNNVNISVKVLKKHALAVPAGEYNGTLIVLVEPT